LFNASIFRRQARMLIVGLTGGVASGKTTVSRVLREDGAYIIDADLIARELVQPHTPTWDKLVRVFGRAILDGDESIHRRKLAAIVFSNPEKMNFLNQMIHPRIKKEWERRIAQIGQKDPEAIVVIDAALLVELGDHREMDKVVVVTSTERQQIERLKEREGASEEEARKILFFQMALDEKVKVADFVIHNEGSLEETRRMAKEVFRELKKIALQKDKHSKSHGSS
jgi:dephospho-CoA kinase